ncbi:hypothetical protein AB1K84_21570 [Mesobacillus foraminis]|uniref:hypothetical protein n=1 Tax=Mesobacillus foraminis TaxID=279826 RepID=UPI0039A06060
MCVSNHAFELQTHRMYERIQKESIYRLVRIVYTEGKSIDLPNEHINLLELITKITIKDNEGNIYEIEPSESGLRFARGDISYKEYLRLQKKETRQMITILTVLTSSLFITGWAFIKYLI